MLIGNERLWLHRNDIQIFSTVFRVLFTQSIASVFQISAMSFSLFCLSLFCVVPNFLVQEELGKNTASIFHTQRSFACERLKIDPDAAHWGQHKTVQSPLALCRLIDLSSAKFRRSKRFQRETKKSFAFARAKYRDKFFFVSRKNV